MKEVFQFQRLYIGIDVSKLTLDVCFISGAGTNHYQRFDNSKAGQRSLHKWLLQQEGFTYAAALFCMEHTGLYTRPLVEFLLLQSARVWMESALHLKRSTKA
jgi:transposase